MHRRTFLSLAAAVPGVPEGVSFQHSPGRIRISLAGRSLSTFYYGPEWDKPFMWPLRTATGMVISRGFPLETRAGESQDHSWQRGIWFAHGDVNGTDFWRELGREKTGTLVPRRDPVASASQGSIAVDLDLLTPARQSLGGLRQEFRFARAGRHIAIDARAIILADRGVSLKLGDTEESWLGIRLHDAFREDRGATLTNSEGVTGRAIWGRRARWVDYTTSLEGQTAGAAVFDHPSNPRHPTWWHARNYGLCAANPFGERNFTGDKSRDGSLTVPEGGRLAFRYRIVIHSGTAREAAVESLYAAYGKEKQASLFRLAEDDFNVE